MKKTSKKQIVSRPEPEACLCWPDDLPEGFTHECSNFTTLRPTTADHLRSLAARNGQPDLKTGHWVNLKSRLGRVRQFRTASGQLIAEIEHGDYWPTTMEEWVQCYQDHKLCSVLLPPLDATSSVDVVEPWKFHGVGLRTGVKSNGLFCIALHTEESIHIGPHYLSPTQRIHGRSGSPKQSWWYMETPVPPTTTYRDASGTVLVDVLGEGCMIPVPPTIHASGERFVWQPLFPVEYPPCWSSPTFEESAKNIAACTLVARAWGDAEGQSGWAEHLANCLIAAGLSTDFVAHFVATAAIVDEDVWHEVYAAVLEHVAESTPQDSGFRWDVALEDLLGKDSANLLVNWLNLPVSHSCHEALDNQKKVLDGEDLDLGLLSEGYFYCSGEPLEHQID